MNTQVSRTLSHVGPRSVKPFKNFPSERYKDLEKYGITFKDAKGRDTVRSITAAMDGLNGGITTPTIPGIVQKLQHWMPGAVYIATAPLKIDVLVGQTTIGDLADEEIVQMVLELKGLPGLYGDFTDIPLSSWNPDYERRTIVRFEEGMQIGDQEAARAARIGVDSAKLKREAAIKALEIRRNKIGFSGFNNGAGLTYGFLNDPGLPGYLSVAAGAAGPTTWVSKTFLEIFNDIVTAAIKLQTQSKDLVNAADIKCTLAISTAAVGNLARIGEFNIPVRKAIMDAYPQMRIESAPELDGADGGANVFYLYAERLDDQSTDGGRVFDQWINTRLRTTGVKQDVKSYVEGFANGTAGTVCLRPIAVVRYSGI